jgi:hypothetical protein
MDAEGLEGNNKYNPMEISGGRRTRRRRRKGMNKSGKNRTKGGIKPAMRIGGKKRSGKRRRSSRRR